MRLTNSTRAIEIFNKYDVEKFQIQVGVEQGYDDDYAKLWIDLDPKRLEDKELRELCSFGFEQNLYTNCFEYYGDK